ncbi:hypothetical protein ABSL23_00905 (plasmid) [Halobacterium sp. NMX12-1]|uniref:TFIIS-type domain-containing protein n=1 Tax=Halobacterium sp. NMX12-1 TaxID=3166650 RepID=A0AAU8C8D6_9EURY
MAVQICPECGEDMVFSTTTDFVDEDLIYVFECPECGHEWTTSA